MLNNFIKRSFCALNKNLQKKDMLTYKTFNESIELFLNQINSTQQQDLKKSQLKEKQADQTFFCDEKDIQYLQLQYIDHLNTILDKKHNLLKSEKYTYLMHILPQLKFIKHIYFSSEYMNLSQNIIHCLISKLQSVKSNQNNEMLFEGFDIILKQLFDQMISNFQFDRQQDSFNQIIDIYKKQKMCMQFYEYIIITQKNISILKSHENLEKLNKMLIDIIKFQLDNFKLYKKKEQKKIIANLFDCVEFFKQFQENETICYFVMNYFKEKFLAKIKLNYNKLSIQMFQGIMEQLDYFQTHSDIYFLNKRQFINLYFNYQIKQQKKINQFFELIEVMNQENWFLYKNIIQYKTSKLLTIRIRQICTRKLQGINLNQIGSLLNLIYIQNLDNESLRIYKKLFDLLKERINFILNNDENLRNQISKIHNVIFKYVDCLLLFKNFQQKDDLTLKKLANFFLNNLDDFSVQQSNEIYQQLIKFSSFQQGFTQKIFLFLYRNLNFKNLILIALFNTHLTQKMNKYESSLYFIQSFSFSRYNTKANISLIDNELNKSKKGFFRQFVQLIDTINVLYLYQNQIDQQVFYLLKSQFRVIQHTIIYLSKIILKSDFLKDIDLKNEENFNAVLQLIQLKCLVYANYNLAISHSIEQAIQYIIKTRDGQYSDQQLLKLLKSLIFRNDTSKENQNNIIYFMNILLDNTTKKLNYGLLCNEILTFLGQLSFFDFEGLKFQQFTQSVLEHFQKNYFAIPLKLHYYVLKIIFMQKDIKNSLDFRNFCVQYLEFQITQKSTKNSFESAQILNLYILKLLKLNIFDSCYQLEIEKKLEKILNYKNSINNQQRNKARGSHTQNQFANFLTRLGIQRQTEYLTEFGYVDIMIGNSTVIEINGDVHYFNDYLDLKTEFKKEAAKLLNYTFICVKDQEFKSSDNKKKYIYDLFIANDLQQYLPKDFSQIFTYIPAYNYKLCLLKEQITKHKIEPDIEHTITNDN